jgi:small subunit ribosomal protein S5
MQNACLLSLMQREKKDWSSNMAENAQPKVINKSGTLRMTDETAKTKTETDIAGRPFDKGRGRGRRDAVKADVAPKEFDEVTISIDRVARVVAGGRRFRFKALVAVGNKKNKVGIGIAKGTDVTAAVTKATSRAKKNMITVNLNSETIYHEVETKVAGAKVLLKPAAPGTGIIAGGVVRSIIALTGIKSLISKSLGSTNKANIAYATIEGLKAQVPRDQWHTTAKKSAKPAKTLPPVIASAAKQSSNSKGVKK